jgi:hypothetical protein
MRPIPSIAARQPEDVDVYLVLNDFGTRLGRAWCEASEERTDRETVITDLIDGQYSDPARVVAFNSAEGWSRDASEDIARDLEHHVSAQDLTISDSLQDFIEGQLSRKIGVQLPLPLYLRAA